jgi:hypothetical protein
MTEQITLYAAKVVRLYVITLAIIYFGCPRPRSAHGLIGCVCVDNAIHFEMLRASDLFPCNSKTELALKESKLPYKRYEIDLQNKPEWYAPKVNPASKVRMAMTTRGKFYTD